MITKCSHVQCLCFRWLDPQTLLDEQRAEFGPSIECLKATVTVCVPDGETKNSTSHYLFNKKKKIPLYLPSSLRKRSSLCDQLVVPAALKK